MKKVFILIFGMAVTAIIYSCSSGGSSGAGGGGDNAESDATISAEFVTQ